MIQIKGLTKKFGSHAVLEDLDLCVEQGSVCGLIGINGSGKTTLIRQLCGIVRPDAGEILINGRPVWDDPEIKEMTGYVPDELYFPCANLRSMAAFYKGMYKNFSEERFHAMTAEFGLDEKAPLRRFSKGMKKQAAFTLIMSIQPKLLVLDEPIDGLDPIMRRKLWSRILGDVADRKLTVLLSSHNLRELEGICDCVAILKNGKIVFRGSLDELQQQNGGMSLEDIFLYEMEADHE